MKRESSLLLFPTVAIPASILDMDFKKSTLAVLSGVLLAGAIMLALSLLGVGAYHLTQ